MYLLLGRRRLGKTTLAYSMARKCPRRIIFDPRGQIFSEGLRVSTPGLLSEAIGDMSDDKDPLTEIIVTPDHDVQAMFDQCAGHVKDWAKDYANASPRTSGLMFLIDEVRFVKLLDSPNFEYVMRAAPPELINIAITGHRPADIVTDVRAISDVWLMFRCTQEHDLKVIKERCGEYVATKVAALQPHEFIKWDDATATASEFKNPKAWYVPLRLHPPAVTDDDEDEVLPSGETLNNPPAKTRLDTGNLFDS